MGRLSTPDADLMRVGGVFDGEPPGSTLIGRYERTSSARVRSE